MFNIYTSSNINNEVINNKKKKIYSEKRYECNDMYIVTNVVLLIIAIIVILVECIKYILNTLMVNIILILNIKYINIK